MTDEERKRTMDFILEHQAQFAASIQRLDEERIRDRAQRSELRKSFKLLVELNLKNDERLDSLDSTTSTLERKIISFEEAQRVLARLVEKNRARLDKLESRS